MNKKELIETLFPFNSECEECNGKLKVVNNEIDEDDELSGVVNINRFKTCPVCAEVKNKRFNAEDSGMNRTELKYVLKTFIKVPVEMDKMFEHNSAVDYLRTYLGGIEKAVTNVISLYLYSKSSNLSNIVGCLVLNKFLQFGHDVKIYNGPKILDTILDSYKISKRKYNKSELEGEESNKNHVYFDELETKHKVIFVHDMPFKSMGGATRNKFSKFLYTRKRLGLLTIISSNIDYYDAKKDYSLDNHISVELGVDDVAHHQASLIGKIN